ncbi:hypothetical protein [Halalkalibacter lacteus]|uniref:hypothetical protein n=1 Tax=Halalkalibacter lacteus TaxID=3090663 RepID=UPI002FC6EE23
MAERFYPAALSFLGLGLQPSTPDWGFMINDARPYFRSYPHLILLPGMCIIAVTLAMHYVITLTFGLNH